MTIGMVFSSFFSYVYKTYGENKEGHPPISDKLLTWATIYSGGLAAGISRILFGLCLDVWSFQILYAIVMTVQLINALIVYHAVYYPWLFITCIFVNQAVSGCVYAGIPVASVKVFG